MSCPSASGGDQRGYEPDERFRKEEHLLKTRDFRKAFKNGAGFKSGAVILYALANGLGSNRLGFSISSKSVGRAAMRNRIRRYFKEAYRRAKKELKKGVDLVLVVKKDPGKAFTYKEAEKIFWKLAESAGMQK